MKIKLKIKDKEYDVEILEEKRGVKIKVGQKEFLFQEPTLEEKLLPKDYLSEKKEFKEKEIKAPIAGLISEIFIREGESVKRGQKLLLLSAMKMENEIVSDSEAKIKKILVKKEQKVKNGEILIILE